MNKPVQAELQLARSQRQFRVLFETMPCGVVFQDAEGTVISMNPTAEQILGKSRAQLLGRPWIEEKQHALREDGSLFPSWEHPSTVALRTGHQVREVAMGVYNPREEAYRWINIAAVPLFRPGQDKPHQVYAHFYDITERRQAEEALRQSEERYRRLFMDDLTGDFLATPEGRIIECNPAFAKIYGFADPAEAVQYDLAQLNPEDWAALVARLRGECILHNRKSLHRCHDGRQIWVVANIVGHFSQAGELVEVQGYVYDDTQRRQAEEALRRSEQRYRQLFEANLAGTYLTKVDGTILDFNEAMRKMLGYESREEVFQHHSSDFYADPEFRKELIRLLQKDGIVPGKEAVLQRKDGSVLYAIGYAVLLTDEKTGEPFIQGVAIDITPRKQAEEMLYELTRTLESKVAERTAELEHRARQLQKLTLELSEAEDRERKRLAEILHDDLQQVLAAAKFQAGILSARMREDTDLQGLAVRIKELLKEAMDKSRSLSHELSSPALAHSDLFEVFEWLVKQMQTKHGLKVRLDVCDRIELPSEPLRVLLYKAALELLFNVIKHAGVREATLRLRHRRDRIYLSVSDKGRGFDPTEPGALGFGLQSIRERVELLGGRMKIRGGKGKGSIFLIVVPDAHACEMAHESAGRSQA